MCLTVLPSVLAAESRPRPVLIFADDMPAPAEWTGTVVCTVPYAGISGENSRLRRRQGPRLESCDLPALASLPLPALPPPLHLGELAAFLRAVTFPVTRTAQGDALISEVPAEDRPAPFTGHAAQDSLSPSLTGPPRIARRPVRLQSSSRIRRPPAPALYISDRRRAWPGRGSPRRRIAAGIRERRRLARFLP